MNKTTFEQFLKKLQINSIMELFLYLEYNKELKIPYYFTHKDIKSYFRNNNERVFVPDDYFKSYQEKTDKYLILNNI